MPRRKFYGPRRLIATNVPMPLNERIERLMANHQTTCQDVVLNALYRGIELLEREQTPLSATQGKPDAAARP
jgi:hypothetical protein